MANTVMTGKVRASFVHIFEPTAYRNNPPRYSCSLIIPKTDKETISAIRKAIDAAIEDGKVKWGGKVPPVSKLTLPLHDGDEDRPEDPAYANSYYVKASSLEKPGIVDRDLTPITDPRGIYPGCYIRAVLNLYPYDANGSKGVAAGLAHVQFWADGEPLNGRTRAEDVFTKLVDDDDDFLS